MLSQEASLLEEFVCGSSLTTMNSCVVAVFTPVLLE